MRIQIGEEGVEASVRRTHMLLGELLRHEHASLAMAQRCSGVPAPAPLFCTIELPTHGVQSGSFRRGDASPGGDAMVARRRTDELSVHAVGG